MQLGMLCILLENTVIAMEDKKRKQMLGRRLLEARRGQRLSQQRAADIIGVARGDLVSWEEGDASPSAIQLGCIAMTYGVCAHALLFGAPWAPFNIAAMIKPQIAGTWVKR
jgi:DNA-binding XRE family transcriptional regulator